MMHTHTRSITRAHTRERTRVLYYIRNAMQYTTCIFYDYVFQMYLRDRQLSQRFTSRLLSCQRLRRSLQKSQSQTTKLIY